MKRSILSLATALLTLLGTVEAGPLAKTFYVSVTSYNSLVGQTDSTPFITATGSRTRMGVVAASPDIIRQFGYGAKVRFISFGSSNNCKPRVIPKMIFTIEDTTAARKVNQIDIWLPHRSQSITFGRCYAKVNISR